MQHNRKYRNLGWWAAHWLFYNLGRIQNDGNLNDGFWLIQKLDCFANKLKNPIILWSKLCIIWLFVYDYLLKLQLFSDFSPVCYVQVFPASTFWHYNSKMSSPSTARSYPWKPPKVLLNYLWKDILRICSNLYFLIYFTFYIGDLFHRLETTGSNDDDPYFKA